jgi:peptide/nickel transport system substrate-binding protein
VSFDRSLVGHRQALSQEEDEMSSINRFDAEHLRNLAGLPMSRRQLMRRAAAVGLATPVIAGLLAACGDDEDAADDTAVDVGGTDADTDDTADEPDDESEDDGGEDTAEGDAQRGGSLRVGFSGSPDTFDPHHNVQLDSIWINSMMYSRMVRIDHEMELHPDMATDWEVSDDGLEWTFQLIDDAVFHNGRECTAEDWVFSIDRLRDPDEATPFVQDIDFIDDVEAVSDTELVIRLSSAYADLPILAGMYWFRVVPEEEIESLGSQPVGTGPYQLRSHSPGERTVIERFEDYYNPDEEGFLDEIHYITMGEETSRLTGLTGDTIDFVNEVTPSALPMVQDDPNMIIEEVVTGSYQPVVMDVTEPPFDDVRVRQAFKLVLDRTDYLQAVYQGVGTEGNDQPVPPVDPMYADIPVPERDIDRARELLEEAGHGGGLQVELHYTAGRVGLQESALTMQEMAQDAGITIELINHPNDTYWADIWLNRPFYLSNWTGRPMADQALSVAYLSGAPWNEANWSNEEFDDLVREARSVVDEDERRELYRQAQEILAEEGGAIIPYFMSVTGVWHEKVRGYNMHPLRWVEFHRVWIDESM